MKFVLFVQHGQIAIKESQWKLNWSPAFLQWRFLFPLIVKVKKSFKIVEKIWIFTKENITIVRPSKFEITSIDLLRLLKRRECGLSKPGIYRKCFIFFLMINQSKSQAWFELLIPKYSVKSKVFTLKVHESKNNIREGKSDFDIHSALNFLINR